MERKLLDAIDALVSFVEKLPANKPDSPRRTITTADIPDFLALDAVTSAEAHKAGIEPPPADETYKDSRLATGRLGYSRLCVVWTMWDGMVRFAEWSERMRSFRAKAAAMNGKLKTGQSVPLCVDVACLTATITATNKTIPLDSEKMARWLSVLTQRAGAWVSSADLEGIDPELMGTRADRLFSKLPREIKKVIESRPGGGGGYRLKVA